MMPRPRKLHAYELALQCLQSVEPIFKCGKCNNTLKDTYLALGSHRRFCSKCVSPESHKQCSEGREVAVIQEPILSATRKIVIRDFDFDKMMTAILEAVKYLLDHDSNVRDEEAVIDAVCEEINIGTWNSCDVAKVGDDDIVLGHEHIGGCEEDKEAKSECNHSSNEAPQQLSERKSPVVSVDGSDLRINCKFQNDLGTKRARVEHDEAARIYVPQLQKVKKSPKIRSFDDRLQDLIRFQRCHGHCNVPRKHSTRSLGMWCNRVRQGYKQIMEGRPQTDIRLTKGRIKRLEELGFQWTKKKSFEQRLQELVRFKEAYGHCNVPYKHPSLGAWCSNARQGYKQLKDGNVQTAGMTLTPERIKRLEEIGFEWTGKKTFEQRVGELIKFKEAHGHCNVPSEHPNIGLWCDNMRQNYKQFQAGNKQTHGKPLTAEQIKCLESIGFRWSIKESFELLLEELVKFKEAHGHCNIPLRHPSLGRWSEHLREGYKMRLTGKYQRGRMTMTAERIKQLEEIGFVWTS